MNAASGQLVRVERAFSKQAAVYDAYEADHPILKWMRARVHRHVLKYLRPGDRILELNAGTGTDALFFAAQGWSVTATDISAGMVAKMREKIELSGLGGKISAKKCSYLNLLSIGAVKFDYIFSDFGGLNCTADLNPVFRQFSALLTDGGYVSLVMMPRICPWELALVLKGHFRTAMRRLHRRGIEAHIEGEYFHTRYYSPREVMKALGNSFRLIRLEGLGSFTPPPFMENFPRNYPVLFRRLNQLDEKLCGFYPFNRWADHFILTAQFREKTLK